MINILILQNSLVDEYRRSKRIIGGKVVSINQFPWMAGLFASRFAEHPFCGASLISNKHLITAAHCIQGILQSSMLNEYAFHMSNKKIEYLLVLCLIANISYV